MMDVALLPNVCVNCKNERQVMVVCEKCDGVAYCDSQCQKKDFKYHKMEACIQIEKARKDIDENRLDDAAGARILSDLYERMCKNKDRIGTAAVEQLLKWKWKLSTVSGLQEEGVPFVMNCMIALGRYQESLDFAAHWRKCIATRDLVPDNQESCAGLIYKKWLDEKQDIAQKFDLERFASPSLGLKVGYNLVLIKLHVIAVMENHLSKRERFLTFMQGKLPRLGSDSNVIRIAGMIPAVRLIAKYCDISANSLGIPSIKITRNSVAENRSHLISLLEQIHSLDPFALHSMFGPEQASKYKLNWPRVFPERLLG